MKSRSSAELSCAIFVNVLFVLRLSSKIVDISEVAELDVIIKYSVPILKLVQIQPMEILLSSFSSLVSSGTNKSSGSNKSVRHISVLLWIMLGAVMAESLVVVFCRVLASEFIFATFVII